MYLKYYIIDDFYFEQNSIWDYFATETQNAIVNLYF